MAKRSVITDSVVLPATADELFETYLDRDRHSAITGHPVTISAEAGSPFEAFDGMLRGTMLQVVSSQLIVQSWRSGHFHDDDPDSTLILMFSPTGDGGRIDLVHLDVPPHDYEQVVAGWKKHYWDPWLNYFSTR